MLKLLKIQYFKMHNVNKKYTTTGPYKDHEDDHISL